MEYVTLQNNVKLPMLGYGTIGQAGEQITDNVAFALNHGYELIDTANRYGNEVEVGRGLKKSGLRREEIFLETKLGPTLYENEAAIDGTLERAYKAGKLRAIGVSNFPVEKLREVLDHCEIPPMVMQVEGHPYYPAEAVKPFCDQHHIQLQCWYPLGHGSSELLQDPVIGDIAQAHGKSAAQVVLRWHIQMGFCPVPGSKSPAHIQENGEIFDFSLSQEDMDRMAGVNRHTPFYQVTPESLQRLATTKCNFEE